MLDWNENAMDILYPETVQIKTQFYESLAPDTLNLQNSLWEELKIESSVEPWIYITALSIIIFLAAILLYNYILKKIRNNY